MARHINDGGRLADAIYDVPPHIVAHIGTSRPEKAAPPECGDHIIYCFVWYAYPPSASVLRAYLSNALVFLYIHILDYDVWVYYN